MTSERWLHTAALALIGGVLWALCFGSEVTPFLPWIALVPLVEVSRRRGAFLAGWLHGFVFWLVSIHWIVGTLESYGGLSQTLAVLSLVLLAAYLGVYHAVFAAVAGRLWKRWPAAVLWALPALWVTLEVVRAQLFSGFPWNLAAYAWIEVPGALDLSAWIGAYGVSFLVVAVNVAVRELVSPRRARIAAPTMAVVAIALVLAATLSRSSRPTDGGDSIRIVQPNTPILAEWDQERVLAGYRKLLELTARVCEPGTLVVWPESAAWPFELRRDQQLDETIRAFNERGCSVILNSTSRDGERYYNSAFLLRSGGEVERYDKQHLVPFGEYVPLRRVLPFLERLARSAGDFSPGVENRLLDWADQRFGMAICFEIVFPGEVAARVRDGATTLVTVTNDGWYGDTAAPWQHFRAARFRAAENRRPLVRAALTGISAFVSERGKIQHWLDVGAEGVLAAPVRGVTRLSFYTRFSWLVPTLCPLLLAFAILRPARRRGGSERTDSRPR